MKTQFFLFSTFIFCFQLLNCTAQNLVPNPSFEEYDTCPNYYNIINYSTGWYSCGGTPDYYNSCTSLPGISIPNNMGGFQYPPSLNCNAYAGFYGKCNWTNCREYIGTSLISPLIINQKYFFSVKVNLANESNCGINKLGVIFSTVSHIDYTGLSPSIFNFAHIYTELIITDTVNWVEISGSFVADSTYQYLLFGHFFDDAHTDSTMLNGNNICQAYYYVDDFCISTDSSYCYNYSYTCVEGINNYKESNIEIFPNPACDEITIDIPGLYQNSNIVIYSPLGEKIINTSLTLSENKIDISNLYTGLYFIQINFNNRIYTKKILFINKK